jgi:uncharacterized protein YndB with AHSA1/START domain
MGKEFEIRREVELSATPEQVWEAVATGPGTASWLFPEEPGPGDLVESDRPHRYAVRTEGEGGFNAIEFVIEAREGGTTVLRYVHSGVFDESGWDDQYDAVGAHTDFYLHTLAQYVEHFAPRTATYVGGGPEGLNGPEASMTPDAFEQLKRALGASAEGDSVSVPNGGGDGVVDYATDKFLGIRTGDALYRFFGRNAWGGPVGMSVHHFGDIDADAAGRAWRDWLASVY